MKATTNTKNHVVTKVAAGALCAALVTSQVPMAFAVAPEDETTTPTPIEQVEGNVGGTPVVIDVTEPAGAPKAAPAVIDVTEPVTKPTAPAPAPTTTEPAAELIKTMGVTDTENKVDTIVVSVDALPVAGEAGFKANFSVVMKNGDAILDTETMDNYWCGNAGYNKVKAGDAFVAADEYQQAMVLHWAGDGRAENVNIVCSTPGVNVVFELDDTILITYTCPYNDLTNITIGGINAPEVGKTVADAGTNVTFTGAPNVLAEYDCDTNWYNADGDKMDPTDVFEAGKTYYLPVAMAIANSNWQFANNFQLTLPEGFIIAEDNGAHAFAAGDMKTFNLAYTTPAAEEETVPPTTGGEEPNPPATGEEEETTPPADEAVVPEDEAEEEALPETGEEAEETAIETKADGYTMPQTGDELGGAMTGLAGVAAAAIGAMVAAWRRRKEEN